MEIGTTNISAMVGPYVAPLATATEKFGIPYFVTTPVEHKCYRPFNMISVSPDSLDLLRVATEVVNRYQWSYIAIIYDSDEGKKKWLIHVLLQPAFADDIKPCIESRFIMLWLNKIPNASAAHNAVSGNEMA